MLLKSYFEPMQRLLILFCVFPILHAKYMSTLSEGYAYHMFSLFLGYLNSKQTLFKSYLINCSLFHFPM